MRVWQSMRSLPWGTALLLAVAGGCSHWDSSSRTGTSASDAELRGAPPAPSHAPAAARLEGGNRNGPPVPVIAASQSQRPAMSVQQVQPTAGIAAAEPDPPGDSKPRRLPPIEGSTAGANAAPGETDEPESLDAAFTRMRQAALAMQHHGRSPAARPQTRVASEAPEGSAEPVRLPTARR